MVETLDNTIPINMAVVPKQQTLDNQRPEDSSQQEEEGFRAGDQQSSTGTKETQTNSDRVNMPTGRNWVGTGEDHDHRCLERNKRDHQLPEHK